MKPIERDRIVPLFEVARTTGAYDDLPLIPKRIDPQVFLSRNDRPQPFFLACSEVSVVAALAGTGTLEFRSSTVNRFTLVPGDHVKVPPRTPHRVSDPHDLVLLRYKAQPAGIEAIAWYCPACDAEIVGVTYDADAEIPQEIWARETAAFNATAARRTCACGAIHPPLDLSGTRWLEVAQAIRAGDAERGAEDGT